MTVISRDDIKRRIDRGIKTLVNMRGYSGIDIAKMDFTKPLFDFIEYLNSIKYYWMVRVNDPDLADTCEKQLDNRHKKLIKTIKNIDYGDVYLKRSIEEAIRLRDQIKNIYYVAAISE